MDLFLSQLGAISKECITFTYIQQIVSRTLWNYLYSGESVSAMLTGPGVVMESVGSIQVCVTLDSTPTSEVNITLETDDTPTSAQGKLFIPIML